ncbi:MAG TPA: outer membrane protein transport protein [Candidatus Acidoferrales bacterium]|nr:outer membrane protein transport protein [Candidatus Acidoferrales bacterium]
MRWQRDAASSSIAKITILLAAYCVFSPPRLCADGFRNPFQSASAIAQGNAFAAQADDASALFYNPAAMTELRGIHLLAGVELIHVDTRFRNTAGEKTENDLGGPFGVPPPGQLFVTATPRDLGVSFPGELTIGLGVQNLFGFAARYPKDGPLRTVITSAKLPVLDFKPTVAYRAADWLSLGLGGDIFTFWDSVLGGAEQKFVSPGLPGMPAGSRVRITGTGTTATFNVSAFVTPLRAEGGARRMSLAFVYRGAAALPLNGELSLSGARIARSKSSLRFPESYTAGVAVWPIRDSQREWKIESDVDYVRWSTLRSIDFRFSNGVTLRNPQDWRDAVSVGIGTEHRWLRWNFLPDWEPALRAGYLWSMTPVPDKNFNPAFADSNVHVLSIGGGLTCRPGGKFLGLTSCGEEGKSSPWRHAGIDFAYQLLLFEPRIVSGHPNPAANGRYKTINQSLVLSFRAGF